MVGLRREVETVRQLDTVGQVNLDGVVRKLFGNMPGRDRVYLVQAGQGTPQPHQRSLRLQPITGGSSPGNHRTHLQLAERQQQLVTATTRPTGLFEQARAHLGMLFTGLEDLPYTRPKVTGLGVVFSGVAQVRDKAKQIACAVLLAQTIPARQPQFALGGGKA
ncbi:hypothetical protein D3C80_1276500 [compost metagenome]